MVTPMSKTDIYAAIIAAGIPIDHHYSDLYVLATPEARAIIKASGWYGVTSFISQIDGRRWYDVPFAYAPFWEPAKERE